MLDLTVFNLPRGLVALNGYRPKVSLNAQFEGRTTYLTLSVEFYKDPHFDSYAVPRIDIDFTYPEYSKSKRSARRLPPNQTVFLYSGN